MRRFTTPRFEVDVGADLTGCDVYLTLRQGRREIDVTDFDSVTVDGDVTTLTFTLAQAQSARFSEGREVEIQANVIDQAGYRVSSEIAKIDMGRQLMEREVSWQRPDLT